jgi:hypothetical protein
MRIPAQSVGQRRFTSFIGKTEVASTKSKLLPQQLSPLVLNLDLVAFPSCHAACSACFNRNIPISQRIFYYCPICHITCGG